MAEESVRTRNKAKTQQRLPAAARELFYGVASAPPGSARWPRGPGLRNDPLRPLSLQGRARECVLEDSDRRWREFLEERLSGCEDSRDGLLAVCDAYREYFTAREVRGCAFVNCAAEFPAPATRRGG